MKRITFQSQIQRQLRQSWLLLLAISTLLLLFVVWDVARLNAKRDVMTLSHVIAASLRSDLLRGNLQSTRERIKDATSFEESRALCVRVFDPEGATIIQEGEGGACRKAEVQFTSNVFFGDHESEIAYRVEVGSNLLISINRLLLILLVICIAIASVGYWTTQRVKQVVVGWSAQIRSILQDTVDGLPATPKENIQELALIEERFLEAYSKTQEEKEKAQAAVSIAKLASQVAHDIRSPLAALDAIGDDLKLLPEDTRTLARHAITRIRDIANNLVTQYRDTKPKTSRSSGTDESKEDSTHKTQQVFSRESVSPQLLSSTIDSIVSEKRAQLRSRLGVTLEFPLTDGGYGLFAEVPLTEFKRVLSNLINNAAEAIEGAGHVTVMLEGTATNVKVNVRDTGKGIPPEFINRLGERGFTLGKAGGTGLGLNHAIESVRSWGGDVGLKSELGQGTTVTLSFPRSKAPEWFVPELEIVSGARLVILDDDASIHQIWDGRLESANALKQGVEVSHFSASQDLVDWLRSGPGAKESERPRLFLLDYELIGDKRTGLDVAEELEICDESILITSRYEEPAVRARCERLGVQLIPKGMAGFVPILIS